MWELLIQNKEWIFSGVGVAILGSFIAVTFRKRKRKIGIHQRAESQSTAILAHRDIHISVGNELKRNTVSNAPGVHHESVTSIESLVLSLNTNRELYACAKLISLSYQEYQKEQIVRLLTRHDSPLRPRKRSLILAFLLSRYPDMIRDRMIEKALDTFISPAMPPLIQIFEGSGTLIELVNAKLKHKLENSLVEIPMKDVLVGISEPELTKILSQHDVPQSWIEAECPKHMINVKSFKIGYHVVTNIEYSLFDENHSFPPESSIHPATDMTWIQAHAFAEWWGARLPTEVEWLTAATSGDGRIYPWGNEYNPTMCNCEETGIGHTVPVDSFPEGRSPYGCYNMCGNVWELTSSAFRPFPYSPDDGRENLLLREYRVIKGGSYSSKKFNIRCNTRDYRHMDSPNSKVGFRIAIDD